MEKIYYFFQLPHKEITLEKRGYYKQNIGYELSLKAALANFQKDHGLPIGSLDIKTLNALGVRGY